MKYFVYILKCRDGTLYTGSTNNLEKRLRQHNNSKQGAHYTKIRRPVKLVYSENLRTLKKALAREYEIKNLTRTEKLNLCNKSPRSRYIICADLSREDRQSSARN